MIHSVYGKSKKKAPFQEPGILYGETARIQDAGGVMAFKRIAWL